MGPFSTPKIDFSTSGQKIFKLNVNGSRNESLYMNHEIILGEVNALSTWSLYEF